MPLELKSTDYMRRSSGDFRSVGLTQTEETLVDPRKKLLAGYNKRISLLRRKLERVVDVTLSDAVQELQRVADERELFGLESRRDAISADVRLVKHNNLSPNGSFGNLNLADYRLDEKYSDFKRRHGAKPYVASKSERMDLKAGKRRELKAAKARFVSKLGMEVMAHPQDLFLFDSLTFRCHVDMGRSRELLPGYFDRLYDIAIPYLFRAGVLDNDRRTRANRRKASKDFSYVLVPELGGKRGRFHWHLCVRIPSYLSNHWADPNRYLRSSSAVELPDLKRLWPHGWSSPRPVRYVGASSVGVDAWTQRARFRMPPHVVEKRFTLGGVGGYLGKYLAKDERSRADLRRYGFKTSPSHGFGMLLPSLIAEELDPLVFSDEHYTAVRYLFREVGVELWARGDASGVSVNDALVMRGLAKLYYPRTSRASSDVVSRVVPLSAAALLVRSGPDSAGHAQPLDFVGRLASQMAPGVLDAVRRACRQVNPRLSPIYARRGYG